MSPEMLQDRWGAALLLPLDIPPVSVQKPLGAHVTPECVWPFVGTLGLRGGQGLPAPFLRAQSAFSWANHRTAEAFSLHNGS